MSRARRLLPLLLVALPVVCWAPATSAATHKHNRQPPCAVPKGWHTVARDASAVLITSKTRHAYNHGADLTLQEWRYCLRATGGFRRLVSVGTSGEDGNYDGPPGFLSSLVLAGRYASWVATWEYHGTNPEYRVQLRNLATGALTTIDLGDPTEGYACPRPAGLVSLLLAPAGVAVWQVEGCTISSNDQRQPYSMIQTPDAASGAAITLDSGVGGELANLRLEQCVAGCSPAGSTIAWWTHDGSWRMAQVG
jgi:hypothetical protein